MALILHGLGVSSGVAVGRVYLLHAEPLPIVPDPVPPERVDAEIETVVWSNPVVIIREPADRASATAASSSPVATAMSRERPCGV